MSFREKSLWVQMLAALGVWGLYFWHLKTQLPNMNLPGFAERTLAAFGASIVLLVVVALVLTLLSRIGSTKAEREIRDEREQLADLRAFKWAYVLVVCLLLWVGYETYSVGSRLAVLFDRQPNDGGVSWSFLPALQWVPSTFIVAANHVLLCLVVAELFRRALNIILIRRLR